MKKPPSLLETRFRPVVETEGGIPKYLGLAAMTQSASKPLANTEEEVRSLIDQHNMICLITCGESFAGAMTYRFEGEPWGSTIRVAEIIVDPRFRDQSVESRALERLIRRCFQESIPRIVLRTRKDDTASIALYEELGFAATGAVIPDGPNGVQYVDLGVRISQK